MAAAICQPDNPEPRGYTALMPAGRLALTMERLDVGALTKAVEDALTAPTGGIVTFLGLVRAENLGRRVRFLEYEAYEPLAARAFARIEQEIGERWAGVTFGLHHRAGRLEVGEASIAIVVASPHRAEAFAACRYAIERVKQIAPIWKQEHFEGGHSWIEGATADPLDAEARAEALRRACG
jgi:molybdopterin synthase catalytic subunit